MATEKKELKEEKVVYELKTIPTSYAQTIINNDTQKEYDSLTLLVEIANKIERISKAVGVK